jgi:hypothetical protein
MSDLSPGLEVRLLSSSQKAIIRRGIRAALKESHAELADACRKYLAMYGVSYSALRLISDSPLPEYLAGISSNSGHGGAPNAGEPASVEAKLRQIAPGVTDDQITEMLATYRRGLRLGRFGGGDTALPRRVCG